MSDSPREKLIKEVQSVALDYERNAKTAHWSGDREWAEKGAELLRRVESQLRQDHAAFVKLASVAHDMTWNHPNKPETDQ